MLRETYARLLAGLLVLWGAWAFGVEVRSAWKAPEPPTPDPAAPAPGTPPPYWTLRSPGVVELRELLEEVDRELPAGRFVTVGTRGLTPSQDFFVSLWVTYFLPHHDVVRAYHRWPLERADHLFLYRSSLEDFAEPAVAGAFPRRPVLLREHPAGTVYRIPRGPDPPLDPPLDPPP